YHNKGALAKCMTLVSEDCKRMLDTINELAETSAISRERTRDIYQAIGKLKEVLSMLRLNWLADLVDARLPAAPGEKLEEALTLAASLLFRINTELDYKLEKMERELFSNDAAPGAAEGMNAGRARILHTAIQTLEAVTVSLDEHMASADGSA